MKYFFEVFGFIVAGILIWFVLDTTVTSKQRIDALEIKIQECVRK
jgi:hypothetical protein